MPAHEKPGFVKSFRGRGGAALAMRVGWVMTHLAGLCVVLLGPKGAPAAVTLQGPLINISPSGAFWPAVEYNPFSNQSLVLWVNVADPNGWQLKGRRVDAGTGALLGSEFHVSPDPANIGAIIGAVTYNSTNHEWFIAYQASINGGQDDVLGQRIASDGTLIGGYISLVVKSNYQNAADVAYDPANNRYLVTWRENVGSTGQIFSRIFDATGSAVTAELRLSEVDDRLKYSPKVAFNPVANEFMVIWLDYRNWPGSGQDNGYGDIYGQRVNPSTGAKIGVNIAIYAPLGPPYVQNGQDTPGGITCDTQTGRYAIGVTKLTAAEGYTTVGLVINSNGSQVAPVFNLSRPSFGAQATPEYNPTSGTYFISYEANSGVAGKLVSPGGTVIGGEETIMGTIGSIRDNVLTVRPSDGQYFQVGVGDSGVLAAQRFFTGQAVTQFAAVPGHGTNSLSWVNPTNGDFTGTLIRFRTDAFPTGPTDGTLLADKANTPGSSDSFEHMNLVNGTTYYYAAYAHNSTPVYAPPAFASGKPFLPGDFDLDNDVDQSDFAHLQICLSGSALPYAPGCADADLDEDSHVDSSDFVIFLECLAGANQSPPC